MIKYLYELFILKTHLLLETNLLGFYNLKLFYVYRQKKGTQDFHSKSPVQLNEGQISNAMHTKIKK